jgi:hypothetical protein
LLIVWDEGAIVVAVGGRILLMRPPDILTFMPMADDYVARHLRDRKLQRALMQFCKPEHYFEVRKAQEMAGRTDLIGSGCDALILATPSKAALQARMEKANRAMRGEDVQTIPNPNRPHGYRPGPKTARHRDRR